MPTIFIALGLIALAAQTAPETFTSPFEARTGAGSATGSIRIQIDRYTPEIHRTAMTDAMRFGGYAGFLRALRQSPVVGFVEIAEVKVPIRWAREQPASGGRAISVVTEKPVFFLGGGRADTGGKPRSGFEVALVQLTVDASGRGTGTMAAAARIKPDGKGGVVLEDYADEPIALTSVHR
jgi:hypothetical protein